MVRVFSCIYGVSPKDSSRGATRAIWACTTRPESGSAWCSLSGASWAPSIRLVLRVILFHETSVVFPPEFVFEVSYTKKTESSFLLKTASVLVVLIQDIKQSDRKSECIWDASGIHLHNYCNKHVWVIAKAHAECCKVFCTLRCKFVHLSKKLYQRHMPFFLRNYMRDVARFFWTFATNLCVFRIFRWCFHAF
jgi:hypothetical protein